MWGISNSANTSRCRSSMIETIFIAAFIISNITMFRYGFKLGIKKEQQARLRRLNTLKRLISNRADL